MVASLARRPLVEIPPRRVAYRLPDDVTSPSRESLMARDPP